MALSQDTDRAPDRRRQPAPHLLPHAALLLLAALMLAWSAAAPRAEPAAEPIVIVALGDSLTAGHGLNDGDGFPYQLEAALRARGHHIQVIDAGVSGDTMTGGLNRLDWSVPQDAHAVIVELGANDALRGVDPAITRDALDGILTRLTERGLAVLVAGMVAPPNLGAAYGEAFNPLFPELAEKHGALLYPFFLEGVAYERALNQSDGMHPSSDGVAVIVERMLPAVERLIETVRAEQAGQ